MTVEERRRPARRTWIWVLVVLLLVDTAFLTALLVRERWRERAEGTPVVRGRRVAERMGCFGCHGPGGAVGIPNPGAKAETVPSWPGGTWMMYSDTVEDLRAWILDGHPKKRRPDPNALLAMPAFRQRLKPAELDDLVAYVETAAQFGTIDDEKASAGSDVAQRLGCFGCHGSEGRGLIADPGALKGYVPPWDGDDYPDLVRNDAEFRQWVTSGITDRFRANPVARHIVETEAIRMPAYRDRVKPEEVDALLAYVAWLRKHPRGRG
jgi:mono/diheme cytochrome c family protein